MCLAHSKLIEPNPTPHPNHPTLPRQPHPHAPPDHGPLESIIGATHSAPLMAAELSFRNNVRVRDVSLARSAGHVVARTSTIRHLDYTPLGRVTSQSGVEASGASVEASGKSGLTRRSKWRACTLCSSLRGAAAMDWCPSTLKKGQ